MKDITLWDISIGNGYCRCRPDDVVNAFALLCFAVSLFYLFVSRLFIVCSIAHIVGKKASILFGRGDKNRLFFSLFSFSIRFYAELFFLCRRVIVSVVMMVVLPIVPHLHHLP